MKNLFLLLLFSTTLLFARENPFRTAQKENISEASMGEINKVEKLESISFSPPVESVKIKKITIEYQSVEGQRIKKVYEIEKGLDPLKSIKVSQ